jgi:hypothetical protein
MSNDSPHNLEALRVADQELSAGNTQGKVFIQYSPGSAAFLVDRSVAQVRVSRHLQDAISKQPIVPDNSKQ